MVAFNFKKQFVEAVEEGTKRQTIRAHRKDGRQPKVGDKLQLYYGMRTKQCRKLRDAKCKEVWSIRIEKDDAHIFGWGDVFRDTFAVADGFKGWEDMRDFFKETHGLPFNGILVKW